jgi:filamentous hemagglutinin family protein
MTTLPRWARVRRARRACFVLLTIYSFLLQSTVALANPLDGSVVAGGASIAGAGNTLTVTQHTDRAIINWQQFSIAPGEVTQFVQPNSSAAILNRVTGGNPSALLGTMQSNGQVFLINPNGILIGPGANINVGGLTASTLDVNNAQFMQGGTLQFQGDSRASVVNFGNVRSVQGDIYLIGARVENHGTLSAINGNVGLLAGQSVTLIDGSRPYLPVEANGKSFSDSTGVLNTGTIEAIQAELAANGGNVYALAINNTGTVRANGSVERNGRIYLAAPGGKIANSGDLIARNSSSTGTASGTRGSSLGATGSASATRGGDVTIEGAEIALTSSRIDVSGTHGGGNVRIGGGFQGSDASLTNATKTTVDANTTINADATELGNGGVVIVWSDDTTSFAGNISARGGPQGGNGGFAEVSGKVSLDFRGLAALNAPQGSAGTLLLDPTDFTIDGTNAPGIITTLNGGTNVTITTNGTGGSGDVLVNEALSYDSSAFFGILAHRHIRVNRSIQNNGDGEIALVAGWNGMRQNPMGSPSGIVNGVSFDFADLIANPASFGNNMGSVFVNSASGMQGVAVGTRFGNTTNVAGFDVIVQGGTLDDVFAQIGFRGDTSPLDINSPINVHAKNDVRVFGGSGANSYAQIGHGGTNVMGDLTGNITGDTVGGVTVRGGSGLGAYAQFGHGGSGAIGNIGDGMSPANINVNVAGTMTTSGDLNVRGGNGDLAYGQFGHGGAFHQGDIDGDITVTANILNVAAASTPPSENAPLNEPGIGAYAMLGHGGLLSSSNFQTRRGNIDITMTRVDIGQFETPGSVDVSSSTAIQGFASFAQIGHGGAGALGNNEGNISIKNASDVSVSGGGVRNLRTDRFSVLPQFSDSGDISLLYAQIGHGGDLAEGNNTGDISLEISAIPDRSFGELAISGGFTIIVQSTDEGPYNDARGGRAQIGHGGIDADGDHHGHITVNAGDVFITGGGFVGPMIDTYAQLGHGGTFVDGDLMGDITGDALGALSVEGGSALRSYAQFGHGGFGARTTSPGTITGDILFGSTGEISLLGGDAFAAYAQFGHGGHSVFHDIHGRIGIDMVMGDIDIKGSVFGGQQAYAQFGHGGYGAVGNIVPTDEYLVTIDIGTVTGNVTIHGSTDETATEAYAQFGHGGHSFLGEIGAPINDLTADESAAITIGSIGGNLSILGGDAFDAYAQLGHGGHGATSGFNDASFHGSIFVGFDAGLFADGQLDEDEIQTLRMASSGQFVQDVLVQGGTVYGTYAQLGHGGTIVNDFGTDLTGNIFIPLAKSLTIRGGTAVGGAGAGDINRPFARTGHGGNGRALSNSEALGNIAVITSGDITLEGGGFASGTAEDGGNEYFGGAQLGHGGRGLNLYRLGLPDDNGQEGTFTANILAAGDNVYVRGGSYGGFAQIGFGGPSVEAFEINSSIAVLAKRNVEVTSTMYDAYAQIGNRGRTFIDAINGNIAVLADTGDVVLTATTGGQSQIGHNDDFSDYYSQLNGDIFVIAGHHVSLSADGLGETTSSARIGHGDLSSNADIDGDIVIGVDQFDPHSDGGGQLYMTNHTFIDMGGPETENEVRIFDSRRGAFPVGNIANGAIINGVEFDSSLPPGTLGSWNQNIEFVNWAHEQWGPNATSFTLNQFFIDPASLSYTGPFTFYFLGQGPPPPPTTTPGTRPFFAVYDLIAHLPYPPTGTGSGSADYGEDDRPAGEIAGESSYDVFGQ